MALPTVPESGRGGWAMPLFPTLASLLCSQLLPLPAPAGLFSALSLLPWGSSHVLRGLSGSGTEGLGYCRTCLEYSSPPEAAHASLHRDSATAPGHRCPVHLEKGSALLAQDPPQCCLEGGLLNLCSEAARPQRGRVQALEQGCTSSCRGALSKCKAGAAQTWPLVFAVWQQRGATPQLRFGSVGCNWASRIPGPCAAVLCEQYPELPSGCTQSLQQHLPQELSLHFAWEQQQEVQEMFEFKISTGSGSKIAL